MTVRSTSADVKSEGTTGVVVTSTAGAIAMTAATTATMESTEGHASVVGATAELKSTNGAVEVTADTGPITATGATGV